MGANDSDGEHTPPIGTESASAWLGSLPTEPSLPDSSSPSAAPLVAAVPTADTTKGMPEGSGDRSSGSAFPKPWMVFDDTGQPCAHWNRLAPPVAFTLKDLNRDDFLHEVPRTEFRPQNLHDFFAQHQCGDRLQAPEVTPFNWQADGSMGQVCDEMHGVGVWYRFAYKEPQPMALQGTNTTDQFVWRHAWYDYERCIHSTCLYNVPKVLRDGLLPGANPGKGNVQGVYCYPMTGAALATSSSGYCVYTSPFEDGWFLGTALRAAGG